MNGERTVSRRTGPPTLVDVLRARASRWPMRPVYTFLHGPEELASDLTFSELDRRARVVARALQANGAERGDRAVLLYPPGLEYIAALFGCFYAGVIAIPAYPPRNERGAARVAAIVANAQAQFALSARAPDGRLRATIGEPAICCLGADQMSAASERDWKEPPLTSADVALLQYTSGSTDAPKGVVLTHRNLVHNSSLIQQCFEVTQESRIVSWLPPYHDMGLIGAILQAAFTGAHTTLMSPASYLQRPLRWLAAISNARATHSGGPNFAYELSVQKTTPEQRGLLDLRSWRVAFNGAEPVNADTLARFASAFEACGFAPAATAPCYGLAESTLLVSGTRPGSGWRLRRVHAAALEKNRIAAAESVRESRTLVGCGTTCATVAIADPETGARCAPSVVGEIWVAGPSVAAGYWNSPAATCQAFQAHLADTGQGPFLRTGDLGFVDQDELYVTGRLKDLIIVCGRNLYPQDVERTSQQSHSSLNLRAAAAFSIAVDGEERLVVVQEHAQRTVESADAMERAIRHAITDEHGVAVHAVELVKPGTVPKTSSGKVQRHACKARFLTGTLETIGARCAEAGAPQLSPGIE